MTYADFCQFSGSFIQHMLEMRIVRYATMLFSQSQSHHSNHRMLTSSFVFLSQDGWYGGSVQCLDSLWLPRIHRHLLQALPWPPILLSRGSFLSLIIIHSFQCFLLVLWMNWISLAVYLLIIGWGLPSSFHVRRAVHWFHWTRTTLKC